MEQKEFINNYDFKFKKKYGQNFLIDDNILNNIIIYAEVDSETLVIEIGCGAGALTRKILEQTSKFIGYEIDETLKPVLNTISSNIYYGDFLKQNVKEHIKTYDYNKLYVIANLPYYITTPIINKIIDDELNVDKIIIMVQKEVGDRLSSKPNSKNYGSLTVFINYYFEVKKLFNVSKNVFIPKPNVDSVVISLERKNVKYDIKNENLFFKIVRDSFLQKRKTLKNNLCSYDFSKVEKVLIENGYAANVRAESLPIEMFIKITNSLC